MSDRLTSYTIKGVTVKVIVKVIDHAPLNNVNEMQIRQSYQNFLKQNNLNVIEFPAVGCHDDHFPQIGSAKIAAQEIYRACKHQRNQLKNIFVCVDQENLLNLFEDQIYGYLRHLVEDLGGEPYVCTDILIELPDGLVLIERTNPPYGWALPGGFLDQGESLEEAARREAKEETNLDLEHMKQFHTYSKPGRDPRFHTISTVFLAQGAGKPQFGDDAKGLQIIPFDQLLDREYAFDHKQIIQDYLNVKGK